MPQRFYLLLLSTLLVVPAAAQTPATPQVYNQPTTTVLSSNTNPSVYGNPVTFKATVTPSTAPGTVTFYDGGVGIGTGTLSGGVATYTTSTLAPGSHSMTASYPGGYGMGGMTYFQASTSSILTQTVNRITSSTSVSSSLNPSTYGNSVRFTATVTPSTATGTVTFKDNGTSIGTGTLTSGTATLSISTLAVGSHPITAAYGGDTYNAPSTSSTLTQTVNAIASSTSLSSSSNPSTYSNSVTFTATVTPSSATGTVTFKDNGASIGTGTLSGGTATYSTSTLAVGSHPITAAYGGDTNDSASTSSTLTQIVNQITSSTSVSSSMNPSIYSNLVTFTATVTPSTATGTVTFKDNGTTIGTGTLSGGTATYSTSTLAVGSHPITAAYGGDTDDSPSSSTLTQTMNPTNSSTAVTSNLNPSNYGNPVTFTATVTPSTATGNVTFYDFNGAISLGTFTLNSGMATVTVLTLAPGAHSITATYSGDTDDTPNTSPVLTQTVKRRSMSLPSYCNQIHQ